MTINRRILKQYLYIHGYVEDTNRIYCAIGWGSALSIVPNMQNASSTIVDAFVVNESDALPLAYRLGFSLFGNQ